MTDRSVAAVIKDLDSLVEEYAARTQEEMLVQQQITELREKLSTLQRSKTELRRRQRDLEKEKASAERLEQLRKEREATEAALKRAKADAEKIIAEAPWKDDIYDWQLEGAIKLANAGRALLADVRGMGKTLSSIAYRRLVQSSKTLVATRKSYADEFINELHLREPGLTIVPLIGPNPVQRRTITKLLKNHENFVMVTNFEMWRRASDEAIKDLLSVGFDTIILDEAHQLKNFKSATTQGFLQLSTAIPNVLEMTGTPIQNRPQELFAILHCLYPDLFPDEKAYQRDYCWQVAQNRWKFKPGGLEALMKKMSHFLVARKPADVGHKIPPPDIKHYKLDMDGYPEQLEAYKLMASRALAQIKASKKVLPIPNQLVLMLRQSQLTAWPAGIVFTEKDENGDIVGTHRFDVHQSVKMDWAEDLIKELIEEEQRVVLFSRFKSPIYELEKRLVNAGLSVAVITGDTSRESNQVAIRDFDLKSAPKNPLYQVLLATYDTVGESVNLNAARHAILFDRYWKPSKDDQAIGRIDRINSVDQATVHMAAVQKTIDVYMEALIAEKRDLISSFKTAQEMQDALVKNLEESLTA